MTAPLQRGTLRILLSYHYLRANPTLTGAFRALAATGRAEFMIDSGAFSDYHAHRKAAAAHKPHTPIEVDTYSAWLHEHKAAIWQYVALDAIRNPAQSRANLARMWANGLNPMPVLVYPEKVDTVPELLQHNDHLCVAGGVDADRAFVRQRVQRAFAASGERAQIHGLGFVKWPDMYQLPLASVDSSSWLGGARFGHVTRFTARSGLQQTTKAKILAGEALGMVEHMRRCRVPEKVWRSAESYKTNRGVQAFVTTHAALSHQQFAATRGLRLFLATAMDFHVRILVAIRCAQRADGTFDFREAQRMERAWRALVPPRAQGEDKTAWVPPAAAALAALPM